MVDDPRLWQEKRSLNVTKGKEPKTTREEQPFADDYGPCLKNKTSSNVTIIMPLNTTLEAQSW